MINQQLSKKDLIAYGVLAIPLSFAGIPLYIHAPDFYATHYGVSLGVLGSILLLLRFVDALQDPLIGYLSDQYLRYRALIMIVAALSLVISFALLFSPLMDSYVLWFAIFILTSTTAFSVLTINLNTLGGLWSMDKNKKTTIAGYREALGLIGLIVAVTLPNFFMSTVSREEAFYYISGIFAVLMLLALLPFLYWQKKHGTSIKQTVNSPPILQGLSSLSQQTKSFFLIYGISILASSIPAVLVLFFIRDRLGLEMYTGLFLLAYFLSAAIGISIWQYWSRQWGKLKTWLFAMALAIVSFTWVYFLQAGDFWQYTTICIASGVAFGAELVLPASILADYIHDGKKENQASLHFGLLAFLAKLSLAIAVAISFWFLDIWDFTPATENTDRSLHALSFIYAVIPCFIKLISTYLLWRLINEKKQPDSLECQ